MQELEIKLSIDPTIIRDPVDNLIFEFFQPLAKHYFIVNQTDSYRYGKEGVITRLRAHEDSGDIVFGTKTMERNETGLLSREEKETIIGSGFPKDAIHIYTRFMRGDLPEYAHSSIRRTIIKIADECNVAEVCIDLGTVKTETRQAVISEIELELKKGSLDWLENIAHGLRSQIYAETGYRMVPSPSKGRIAQIISEVSFASTPIRQNPSP